jgi:hypothetical protein
MTKNIDPILQNILLDRSQVKAASGNIPLVGEEHPVGKVSPEFKSHADGTAASTYDKDKGDAEEIDSTADPAIKGIAKSQHAGAVSMPHGERSDYGKIKSESDEGVDYHTGKISPDAYPFSIPKEASFLKKAESFVELQHAFVEQLAKLMKKADEVPADIPVDVPPDPAALGVPPEAAMAAMAGEGQGATGEDQPLSSQEMEIIQQIAEFVKSNGLNLDDLSPEALDMLLGVLGGGGGAPVEEPSEPLINTDAVADEGTGAVETQKIASAVAHLHQQIQSNPDISNGDMATIEQLLSDSLAAKKAEACDAEEDPELSTSEITEFDAIPDIDSEEDKTKQAAETVKTANNQLAEMQSKARESLEEALYVKQAKLQAKNVQQDKKASQRSQVLDSFIHRNNT